MHLATSLTTLAILLATTASASPITGPFSFLRDRSTTTCSANGNPLAVQICAGRSYTSACHYHNPGAAGDTHCYTISLAEKFPAALAGTSNVQSFGPDPGTVCITYRGAGCGHSEAAKTEYAAKGGVVIDGAVRCPGRPDMRESGLEVVSFRCTETEGKGEEEVDAWLKKWNPVAGGDGRDEYCGTGQ